MKLPHEQLDAIRAFCLRWSITEFSLFGSILRGELREDSDVDVCVVFSPERRFDLDEYIQMLDELRATFGGRDVDLVERRLIRNPFRRHEILTTREVVYAA